MPPSATPAAGYEFATLVADIVAFLDATDLRRVHFVGHSSAGIEMTELASRWPERVLSLVYLDAIADPATAHAVLQEDPLRTDPATGAVWDQVSRWWNDHSVDFSAVAAPTLCIGAVQRRHPGIPADASAEIRELAEAYWRERIVPLEEDWLARFRRQVPQARLIVYEDADHYVHLDRRVDVLTEIRRFLRRSVGSWDGSAGRRWRGGRAARATSSPTGRGRPVGEGSGGTLPASRLRPMEPLETIPRRARRIPRLRPSMTVAALAGALLAPAPAGAQKRIALSFDDVPRAAGGFFTPDERAIRLIAALARAGVEQAGFFVTVGGLDRPDGRGGEDRIRAYAAAGHVIANHSTTHPWLSRTDVDAYMADVDRAEEWLRGRAGHRPWFRFPFLDEGRGDAEKRDAVRAALRERGLKNAYVTVDNYDWHLESLAARAKREEKPMDLEALRALYVETLVQAADFYDGVAVRALGRSPAHVLLLHETDVAALFVEDLVAGLRAAGWETVTLDEAYADPISSREPDTLFLGSGRVAALAHEKGWEPRALVHERTDEEVLDRLFAERVLAGAPEGPAAESPPLDP